MTIKIIIPAKVNSARLPDRALAAFLKDSEHGKPMIWSVYQTALATGVGRDNIVVATDSLDIAIMMQASGVQVRMINADTSDTNTVADVIATMNWSPATLVIKIPSDQPLITSTMINAMIARLRCDSDSVVTLSCPLASVRDMANPSVVKVATDVSGRALFFSRSVVSQQPSGAQQFNHPAESNPWQQHIAVFGYRNDVAMALANAPIAPLERLEYIEALRALSLGYRVNVMPLPLIDASATSATAQQVVALEQTR
ncbi:cytidylyltransferase domain-containing protein [Shewanella sp. NIFS-20-20]|uniref:cytidylyltransferase domain-containing protein n=1 Tax=Shewanella sp. NIFS-20-20 TaxID=2853806 RepID=UPI001C4509BA|nr:NTP transferase domain-containing protein [Shewanella sp. NIFS-20-20]MBV7316270.1 NTP transferase domain-containing protein [Shewanella sp. NIFS-20-20]